MVKFNFPLLRMTILANEKQHDKLRKRPWNKGKSIYI